MQFGGTRNRISTPTAPEKGSFPLDHLGECKPLMIEYMKCLKKSNNITSKCRLESKHYLECRMDKCVISDEISIFRELMAKEELDSLGFLKDEKEELDYWQSVDLSKSDRAKEKSGFIPGKKST